MKRYINFFVLLGVTSSIIGCAEVTTRTFGKQRTVTVKYSTGWFMDDKNRAKAMETAQQFCLPARPVLVREDNKAEFTGQTYTSQTSNGNHTTGEMTQSKENNVYMHFVCRNRNS